MKTETFFLDNEDDVNLFIAQCKKENIAAEATPYTSMVFCLAYIDNMDVVELDGRYYDEEELLDFMEQYSNSEVV